MMEWQPIETAPNFGSFLAWDGYNVEHVMAIENLIVSCNGGFVNIHPEDIGPQHFDGDGSIVDDFPMYEIKHVTHWMPLPTPPTGDT